MEITKQETLKNLLQKNILIKQEMKDAFLEKSKTFSEEKLNQSIDFLAGILHQQESIVQKIAEKNPNFANDLLHAGQKGFRIIAEKREKKDRSIEMKEVEKMEQEFLNLT